MRSSITVKKLPDYCKSGAFIPLEDVIRLGFLIEKAGASKEVMKAFEEAELHSIELVEAD